MACGITHAVANLLLNRQYFAHYFLSLDAVGALRPVSDVVNDPRWSRYSVFWLAAYVSSLL
ncbi:hypothetical protein D3C71_1894650 [compost metagenome]